MIPTPTFHLRVPPTGPTVTAQAANDTLLWNVAAQQWQTGQVPVGDSAWLQDHKILSRDDLVAVVAPVAGVFVLPTGSYGIKNLVLEPGEKLSIENAFVRIYGARSSIVNSGGDTQVDVLAGGNLVLDNLEFPAGRLNVTGGTVRMNQTRFNVQAGPSLIQSGGTLWAVNSVFAATLSTVLGVEQGTAHLIGCEVNSDGANAVGVSGSALVTLTDCDVDGRAVVSNVLGSLQVSGGKVRGVTVSDADQVRISAGAVIEGGGTGIGVDVDPATFATSVNVQDAYIVGWDTGIALQNAALTGSVKVQGTDFGSITTGMSLASGPLPVGGGGVLANCAFDVDVAQATSGFNGGSTRWFVRACHAANGALVETAI